MQFKNQNETVTVLFFLFMFGIGCFSVIPTVQGSQLLGIDGSVALKRRPTFMAKLNETILVVAEGYEGLEIVDISNPARPKVVGDYRCAELPDSHAPRNYAWQFVVRYPYVYLAGGIMGLEILDLSDPKTPVLCSRYYNGGTHTQVELVDDLAIFYSYRGELNFINISDPYEPINLGAKGWYQPHDPGWDRIGFTIHNNYIYVSNLTCNSLGKTELGKIYTFSTNTSNLEIPNPSCGISSDLLALVEFPSKYGFFLRDYFIAQGSYLYRASHLNPLEIWNITIPDTPKLVQTVTLGEADTWNILAGQTMLYAVNQLKDEAGSFVSYLNTSNPVTEYNFTAMEHLTFDSSIQTLHIDQELAFIGLTDKLRIRNLSGFSIRSITGARWDLCLGLSFIAVISIVILRKKSPNAHN